MAWAAPMPTATGKVTSSTPWSVDPKWSATHRITAADDERDGDETDLADLVLEEVVEQRADERRRDGRGDEQPGELPVGVAPNERSGSPRDQPA